TLIEWMTANGAELPLADGQQDGLCWPHSGHLAVDRTTTVPGAAAPGYLCVRSGFLYVVRLTRAEVGAGFAAPANYQSPVCR
ncbi:MAG TPA: hypothetical protein VN808_01405, partial [Stellaceae bacterium]|nr:hypothetical protein [Stellaceae bacterium]